MTIQELAQQIKAKNFLFEISISGKNPFGKNNVKNIEELHGSIEEYLNKIAKSNNVTQLGINLFSPNGSSFLRKGFFLVDIVPVDNKSTIVDSASTIVDASTKSVDSSTKSVDGVENSNNEKTKDSMSDIKTEIKNAQLETELRFLKKENESLVEKNKKLERKNNEFYDENLKLAREVSTQKEKLELEYKTKELGLQKERESGLGGLMDSVKEIPAEGWQLLAGFFPNHPMNKQLPDKKESHHESKGEKHANADAQGMIDIVVSLMLKETPEKIGMVSMVMEGLLKNERNLIKVYSKLFPDSPGAQKEENPNEEQ